MSGLHSGLSGLGTLDALARRDSAVHRLDPRAKLLTTVAFIVTVVSWNRYELVGLVPLAAYPVLLCVAGGMPSGYVAKKLLLAAPFVLVLGAFNPVFDTSAREVVGGVAIPGGWISYLSIVLRFLLTVGAALALVAVTGFNPVCAAAEKLGTPRIFVVQLLFLYRYLFVLAEEALRMMRAAALRAPGGRGIPPRRFGSMVGHLLLRTLDRAQRIHLAMSCRGFEGEVPLLRPLRLRLADAAFVAGWVAFFVAVRVFRLPERLGQWSAGAWS